MKNNRKNTRKIYWKRRKIRWIMAGITLAIFILFIYLVITLCMLWKENVKYNNINQDVGKLGQIVAIQQETDGTELNETGINKTEINELGINKGVNGTKINETEISESRLNEIELTAIKEKIQNFAKRNHISIAEYPEEFIELFEKNPETEEFVLNYPLKKETYSQEPLNEYLNKEEIPLFMQWDNRWGYYAYGSSVLGITGCGPTCLSMVAMHLLQNPTLTPIYMAEYAQKNGYYVQGTGTSWEFMSRGASELGLRARELPLDENMVKQHLQNGNPIICIMGQGDFTDSGHFIVLVGVENGKIKINDPNSRERSKKLWEFEDIKYQIKNLWVYFNEKKK